MYPMPSCLPYLPSLLCLHLVAYGRARANGLTGLILAEPLRISQGKNKNCILQNQVINESASVIFGLVRFIEQIDILISKNQVLQLLYHVEQLFIV